MPRASRSWSLIGVALSLCVACKGEEEAPTPAQRYCNAVAAQAEACGASTPCDEALVTDCAGVAGLFNDSLLSAAATCVEEGGSPLGCVVDSRAAVQRSAAHDAFASAFCSECAFGVSGCEETLFGDGDDDELAIAGALITPLGDALVSELQNECASGLTCLATFTSCAQEVLARQALPTETLTCVVDQLLSGEGSTGSTCVAGTDTNDAPTSGGDDDADRTGTNPSDPSDPSGTSDSTDEGTSTSDGGETSPVGSASESESESEGDETAGGALPSDPSYPNPYAGNCPSGTDAVGPPDDPSLGFCAPVCLAGTCPDAATGFAIAECLLSPLSSFDECSVEEDCIEAETCDAGLCVVLPPTHCGLLCETSQACPDGMVCDFGFCLYVDG